MHARVIFAALLIASPALAQPVEIEIHHFSFNPPDVTITAGRSVRWTNHDGIGHTATSQTGQGTLFPSGVFDSGPLNLGESFEFTFAAPGTFHYFCIPHGSSMQGVIHVVPCPADFDRDGSTGILDIFAFLAAWFASEPSAEFDGQPGITVPDIFAFLSLWFAGCS